MNKLDNLDEMDKFLETHNLPKLNQKESKNLNRHIIPSENEAVFKKLKRREDFPAHIARPTLP